MQEAGSVYLDSVLRIAEKEGITPEEVINKGKDQGGLALATGVLLILVVRYLPQGILKEAKVKAEELGKGCFRQKM